MGTETENLGKCSAYRVPHEKNKHLWAHLDGICDGWEPERVAPAETPTGLADRVAAKFQGHPAQQTIRQTILDELAYPVAASVTAEPLTAGHWLRTKTALTTDHDIWLIPLLEAYARAATLQSNAEMQKHRDMWREYAYGNPRKPWDYLDGNKVDRGPTKIEALELQVAELRTIKTLLREWKKYGPSDPAIERELRAHAELEKKS